MTATGSTRGRRQWADVEVVPVLCVVGAFVVGKFGGTSWWSWLWLVTFVAGWAVKAWWNERQRRVRS